MIHYANHRERGIGQKAGGGGSPGFGVASPDICGGMGLKALSVSDYTWDLVGGVGTKEPCYGSNRRCTTQLSIAWPDGVRKRAEARS